MEWVTRQVVSTSSLACLPSVSCPGWMSTVNTLCYGSASVQLTTACLPCLQTGRRISFTLPLSLSHTHLTLLLRRLKSTKSLLCWEKCEGGRVKRAAGEGRVGTTMLTHGNMQSEHYIGPSVAQHKIKTKTAKVTHILNVFYWSSSSPCVCVCPAYVWGCCRQCVTITSCNDPPVEPCIRAIQSLLMTTMTH